MKVEKEKGHKAKSKLKQVKATSQAKKLKTSKKATTAKTKTNSVTPKKTLDKNKDKSKQKEVKPPKVLKKTTTKSQKESKSSNMLKSQKPAKATKKSLPSKVSKTSKAIKGVKTGKVVKATKPKSVKAVKEKSGKTAAPKASKVKPSTSSVDTKIMGKPESMKEDKIKQAKTQKRKLAEPESASNLGLSALMAAVDVSTNSQDSPSRKRQRQEEAQSDAEQPKSEWSSPNQEDSKYSYSTGRWTTDEDELLKLAVETIGPRNWKRVAAEFLDNTRTDVQCLHRWQKVLRPGLVKGPWTKEEDETIIKCRQLGINKWSEIARHVSGRIGKQCRERWFNHLDPDIRKGEWTEEEDRKLIEGQALLGNRWSQIAKLFLPGRPENAVKNRWNAATRRRRVAKKKPDSNGKIKEARAPKKSWAETQARFQAMKPAQDLRALGDAMDAMVSLAMSASLMEKVDTSTSSKKTATKEEKSKGKSKVAKKNSTAKAEKRKRSTLKETSKQVTKKTKSSSSFSKSRPSVNAPAALQTSNTAVVKGQVETPVVARLNKSETGPSLSPSQPANKRKMSDNDAFDTIATLVSISRGTKEAKKGSKKVVKEVKKETKKKTSKAKARKGVRSSTRNKGRLAATK